MMRVTCTFLSPLIHQLLACRMSKNDVVKNITIRAAQCCVSMDTTMSACAVVSSQNLQCQLGFVVLHYINLVVWCLYSQPTIFNLDQFDNQSRAHIDCLMKMHTLQNPPNHPWMINLKCYVKEIPAFFSYCIKCIHCIISSFQYHASLLGWLVDQNKIDWQLLRWLICFSCYSISRIFCSSVW